MKERPATNLHLSAELQNQAFSGGAPGNRDATNLTGQEIRANSRASLQS